MNVAEDPSAKSRRLADFLILESRKRGDLLTPLKLQKLLFYSDAWFMALYNEQLTSEKFQAWVHGPVALSQYHRFKESKWRPIMDEVEVPDFDIRSSKHLKEIIDVFGSETGPALEMMTHSEKPWIEARAGIPNDEPCNNYISKKTTRKYYAKLGKN